MTNNLTGWENPPQCGLWDLFELLEGTARCDFSWLPFVGIAISALLFVVFPVVCVIGYFRFRESLFFFLFGSIGRAAALVIAIFVLAFLSKIF